MNLYLNAELLGLFDLISQVLFALDSLLFFLEAPFKAKGKKRKYNHKALH
tara:strand:- start:246 stop:395 length:150 start_codon:yes stop_codon:yes gene_type:complete